MTKPIKLLLIVHANEDNSNHIFFSLIYTNGDSDSLNLLAHQYLSFGIPQVMAGNFIADSITGKKIDHYPAGIQLGILMHRSIDSFTDKHSMVSQTRKLLYPHFGKYALVVQDVFFDYFLANDWDSYSSIPLKSFAEHVYHILGESTEHMNAKGRRTFEYMSRDNWLYNYKFSKGIDKALLGLSRRAKFVSNMELGWAVLEKQEKEVSRHFDAFFPDLILHVRHTFKEQFQRFESYTTDH